MHGHGYSKATFFLASNVLVFFSAFLTNVLFANLLNPEGFGTYRFAINFILVIQPLMGFGVNMSCARLLSMKERSQAGGTIGAGLVVGVALSSIITAGLYLAHYIAASQKPESKTAATLGTLQIVFPFVVVIMLQAIINSIYQGLGEIGKLALFNILPYLVVLASGAVLYMARYHLSSTMAILVFLGANAVVLLPRVVGTRFSLQALRCHIAELWLDVRRDGLKIYLSSIFTTSASSLIALIFGARYGYTEYGYYALALSLAGAFRMISSSLGIARFRDSASRDTIRRSDLWIVALTSLSIYAVFVLSIRYAFFLFYPRAYEPAIDYLYLLGAANLALGAGEYFNRFLIAKGRSTDIVINSLVTGVSAILMSVILGSLVGLEGLAISALASGLVNLTAYLLSYRRYLNLPNQKELVQTPGSQSRIGN